jgi:DNA polymerase elongation subunit (family B)
MKALLPMFTQKPFEKIIAIDIETSSKGELLDIGMFSEYGYYTFDNWQSFFNSLITTQGNFRIIAHNGFGFDFIGFNQWFLANRKSYNISDDDITYLSSEALIIAMIIRMQDAEFTFLDTMRFFPGQSLQKLAESFLNESKDDVPDDYISRMEDYKNDFRDDYYSYLRKDCEILYRIYNEFRREINEFTDIGELGLSSGSTAMRSFRRWLFTDNPKMRIFAAPDEYVAFADYALRGGLTLYIGDGEHVHHQYENVNHYDVISMYPSVMKSVPVPISPMIYTDEVIKDYDCYRPAWYLCDYEQTKGRVPILFPINSEFPQWKGQAILNHFELQFLDSYGKYTVTDGVAYADFAFPFEKYFTTLLGLRMEAKREKKTAKTHALKILANSLYGKFGQKNTREVISITSDRDWYESEIEAHLRDYDDSGVTEYAVDKDYVIYGVNSVSTAFSNRFIGAMVTSLARLKLGIILNAVHSIYCDTDSIFTQDKLDKIFVGTTPGDFEKDEDSPNRMICLGKKSYQYGNDIKFKGIPARRLTEENIQSMRFDFDVNVEYKSPTAWKTAMKNHVERPNEFLPKSRRVARGKSLSELGMLHSDAKLFSVKESKEFLDSILTIV